MGAGRAEPGRGVGEGAAAAGGRRVDVVVVGAGIVGLATARELLGRHPGLRVVVLDKERTVAAHQSSHNSGVLHAGLYYAPGSLKARLCRAGKAAVERFATERGIPWERCGKLVVAVDDAELAAFEALRLRAEANGVPGLEVLGPAGLRDHEPHAAGVRALWSPTTGIVDFARVAEALADDVRARGGAIGLGQPVTSLAVGEREVVVGTPAGELVAGHAIACAGLWADRVAALSGDAGPELILPFRGDYLTLAPEARSLVRGLIYPVPDARFPFLGIHLTKRIDGEVLAGPNAVLALAREGYRRWDVRPRELAAALASPQLRRLAARCWRAGAAEVWRDWSKRAFLAAVRRYVPELRAEHLRWGPSGVRAQAVDADGTLVDDFRLGGGRRVLHVRNAPSPAATASLAIAAELVDQAEARFDLAR